MINQRQLKGFFEGVKCPECREYLQMPEIGNLDLPFELNGVNPPEGCMQFHKDMTEKWKEFASEKIAEGDYQNWLNQYR